MILKAIGKLDKWSVETKEFTQVPFASIVDYCSGPHFLDRKTALS
jgi:hypothetical protein